ncbi:D-alanine--D-alanine ligase [Candidatus Pacebacteria bacterium]|nr:D-alanine--D-alanine ligase [Candidatus Paceibacterota bacterium]
MNMIHNVRRVAVLRGGLSDEYEVSMNTGAGVLEALAESPYAVEDIIITKKGEWLKNGVVREPKDALAATDVVFIALHGAYGEDGTVQRLLDRLAIPYTGSGAYASALAMNKMLTKEHLKNKGVKMAPHMRVTKESGTNISRIVHTISSLFGPEYVVKPIAGGSSIGTAMANSPSSLVAAIEKVFETYDDLLVEERIRGREATCGVVENFRDQKVYRLPNIEIVPPHSADFFQADVKYTGETEEICPGRFKTEEKNRIEELAHTIHDVMGLKQYSRSDFMVTDDDIYFLEVNTLPGLTENSLVPKSLAAVGCSYKDFIEHLLTDALVTKRP